MIYYNRKRYKVIQQQTQQKEDDYMEHTIKFIEGEIIEGGRITIEINGKQINRVVRYNRMDGLYIVYKNCKYFEYEFDYTEFYKNKENLKG